MKVSVWWMGKTASKYLLPGIRDYEKRIRRYHPLEVKVFSSSKSSNPEVLRKQEAKIFLKNIDSQDYVVLLDESGKQFSSLHFARFIEQKSISVAKKLIFIIGGPHGFNSALYDRSDLLLSLSKMTFTHDMVRLFFLEQIYRAFTINHGSPYHHS